MQRLLGLVNFLFFSKRTQEKSAIWTLRALASISIFTTISILATLVYQSVIFFNDVPIWDFLLGTKWTPLFNPQSFGVLPLVAGTLLVTVIASIVALIFGLSSAIFLSEYAPENVRKIIKPILEILAGIPTVVYGYFALTVITPVIMSIFPDVIIFNALSAGLVMGIMITPMVSTISEDALISVPQSLRDAAYALGARKYEVSFKVVFPAALSGITASIILGLSRAIGETMIVTIAAGATPRFTFNPLESVQAMTAYIVQLSLGEAPHGSLEYNTIFSVGLLLFIMSLLMNIFGRWVATKFTQNYTIS